MKCAYCKADMPDLDAARVRHGERSAYLCPNCRNHRLKTEGDHLVLLDSTIDTRVCLFCGQTQRFTTEGDFEGVRFHVVPCLKIIPKKKPDANKTDMELCNIALNGKDFAERIHAVKKINTPEVLQQIIDTNVQTELINGVIGEARYRLMELQRQWIKGRRTARQIADVLLTSQDFFLWEEAVPKIVDQEILLELYRHLLNGNDGNERSHSRAIVAQQITNKGLLEHVARKDPSAKVRATAAGILRSVDLLQQIASQDEDEFVRTAAMANPHLTGQSFLLERAKKETSHIVLEQLFKRVEDTELIYRRLANEKDTFVVLALCRALPALSELAEDIHTVLDTPKLTIVHDIDYNEQRGEKALAKWTLAAQRLCQVANTEPDRLEPLWDQLSGAINNFVVTDKFYEPVGEPKTSYTEKGDIYNYRDYSWTELNRPITISFPERPNHLPVSPR